MRENGGGKKEKERMKDEGKDIWDEEMSEGKERRDEEEGT